MIEFVKGEKDKPKGRQPESLEEVKGYFFGWLGVPRPKKNQE